MYNFIARKYGREKLLSVGFVFFVLLMIIFYFTATRHKEPVTPPPPENIYDETIVAVADIDYEPYSFIDSKGNPGGYDIELLYALAEKMKVNIEIKLMGWHECMAAIDSGQADIITGVGYRPEDYPGIIFSRAILNDPSVCFGKEKFNNIAELYRKKLAVLEDSGCDVEFLKPYQLTPNATYYSSYTEVIQSVISGENDYAIARHSVGRRSLVKLGEKNVRAVGPMLAVNPVCIGIGGKNQQLLERVNVALEELRNEGVIDEIVDKWLGTYVEIIGFNDFLRIYSNIIFGVILSFVILVGVAVLCVYRERAKAAHIDSLTGINSRRGCDEYFDNLEKNVSRKPCGFMMIDLDRFKQINDVFGHSQGDLALKDVARLLKSSVKASDYVARWGGDEFVIIINDTSNLENMVRIIRQNLADFNAGNTREYVLELSIGYDIYEPDNKMTPHEFLSRVDEMMYKDKEARRKKQPDNKR